jgi:hypothetical protein
MIKVNTTDEKLKMLIESTSPFESPEDLKSYLIQSGEMDFKLTEALDQQVTVLRILKG